MNTVQLNFINSSNDQDTHAVVLFQKNIAPGYPDLPIAWKVIQNLPGDQHTFIFSTQVGIGASDVYGNSTAVVTANPGEALAVKHSKAGNEVIPLGVSKVPDEIEVTNAMAKGAVNINCYRDDKLIATVPRIVPEQLAVFQFEPVIHIGVVRNMVEGAIMNALIVSQLTTKIDLAGLESADIVLTGGGSGTDALPFRFTLTNMKFA